MQNNTFPRLFVGQNIITLASVDSTNNYLKNKLANSAPLPDGTVIMAENQFAGRGQLNSKWQSEPGKNLTCSILLRPGMLNVDQQFLLNKAISIAINEVLLKIIGQQSKIKWPNDIYAGTDKLGGILIENIIQGNKWKYAIIGIGLNVNQVEFSPELKNVTSIGKILHTDYDLKALLFEICAHIEVWYLKLKAGNLQEIARTYLERLYRAGKPGRYKAGPETFTGIITDVSNEGLLHIDRGNSNDQYTIKEIEFI